jgi:superfamily II DNA or RNA helicase
MQVNTTAIKSNKKLKPILISTVQTLASLTKQNLVGVIMKHVQSLMIDEAHHAAASSYMNLLPHMNDVYYRFNFSGTYTRNDNKFMELWGVCDEKLYTYNSVQATKDGYLTPVEFIIKELKGSMGGDYQDEYKLNYGGKVFHDAIVETVKEIPKDKQILILVDRKELVGEQIRDWLSLAGIEVDYLTGDNKREELTEAMERFNEKKTRILVASTVLGEGADIRSTDYLILARGGKSEIAVTQAIGRAVRLHPGKTKAYVIDFEISNTQWLKKHAKLRRNTYVEEFGAAF